MRLFFVLTVILFITSLTSALKSDKVTVQQEKDAIDNLRKALTAKPEAATSGAEFKAVLFKWIQDTDDKVLRRLVPRLQNPISRRPSLAKSNNIQPKISFLGSRISSYENRLQPQTILKRLLAIADEESGAQLKVFLAAMNTPDGQKAIKMLNLKQTVIDDLSKQINGDKEQQTKAKQTYKTILQSITKKEQPKLRAVYVIYVRFDLQQKGIKSVSSATPEQLRNLLSVLVRAEKRYKFTGITFSTVQEQTKKPGVSPTYAAETINKWIEKADLKNLRRLNHYITMTQRSGASLEQIKTNIAKKIDVKSSAQLLEFLEVLETSDGKTLQGKLSVKPSTPVPDLIKKLNTGVKTDEAAVKKILQDWVNKLTANDMKEFQNSRLLFVQFRARKEATLTVQKADEKTLLSILTFLSAKESSGAKFDGIKFTDLKTRQEKEGTKSVQEIKKIIIDWIAKVKLEQLSTLQGTGSGQQSKAGTKETNAKFVIQAGNSPVGLAPLAKNAPSPRITTTTKQPTTKKPGQQSITLTTTTKKPVQQTHAPSTTVTTKNSGGLHQQKPTAAPTTTAKPKTTAKPTTKKPIRKFFGFKDPERKPAAVVKSSAAATVPIITVTDVKTEPLLQQFIRKQNSKVAVTPDNMKKAIAQICTMGSTEDIKTVFTTTTKGSNGHVVKFLSERVFKSHVSRVNERLKKVNTESQWRTMRIDLKNWVNRWNKNQSSLFSIWYKRGVEGAK